MLFEQIPEGDNKEGKNGRKRDPSRVNCAHESWGMKERETLEEPNNIFITGARIPKSSEIKKWSRPKHAGTYRPWQGLRTLS